PKIRELAAGATATERVRLLPILSLFEFEGAFLPVDGDVPPYLDEALEFGKDLERVILNYGAIECLEKSVQMLAPEGFLLVNDYGPVERNQVPGHAAAQRFGSSIALGINFPLLQFHFSKRGWSVLRPRDDGRQIHARLICKQELRRVQEVFMERFSGDAFAYFETPAEEGRRNA